VQKFSKARRGVFSGGHSVPLQTEETEAKEPNPSLKERSSTELRCASFPRAIVRDPGRLSRVEMNALAGALDSRCVQIFRLTRPMTSIDERNGDVATVVLDGAINSVTRASNVRLPTGAFTLQPRIAVDEPLLKSHPVL
jgi:hypothetical protein